MGRVFSYEEIAASKIPTQQDFEAGRRDIIDTINSCSDVLGAIMCGSIIHGTSNVRSDIDVAFFYHETPAVTAAMKGLRERSLERNLDLSLIPIEAEMAGTNFHAITTSFRQHLSMMAAQGGLIKADFTEWIKPWQSERDDLTAYLSHKWRYFNKRLNKIDFMDPSDPKRLETIQKALELGPHVARKMLSLWDVEVESDSKVEVIKAYSELAPVELSEQINRLAEIDRWYTNELFLQMEKLDQERYLQVLDQLAAVVPAGYQFLRGSIMMLHENYGISTDVSEVDLQADAAGLLNRLADANLPFAA
ncbi:MAG TPA: hypothetical protein VLF21_01325 [Candidatus Saccharimonadales bacterium]|nr:hypothetical protein [Candidatus Saccharimonadales bacterium]